MSGLLERLSELAPDVILIDLENPSRDVLEQMFEVSRLVRRPIAMFVDESDMGMIEAAVEAGVGAYVLDGLTKARIKAILAPAITRFNTFTRLHWGWRATQAARSARTVINRPKGTLLNAQDRHDRG